VVTLSGVRATRCRSCCRVACERRWCMPPDTDLSAFPVLTSAELCLLRPLAEALAYEADAIIFRAGTAELDLFVVEEGGIEIQNPSDNNAVVVKHHAGGCSGDI